MKIDTLFHYAQVHSGIYCVLNSLQSPYGEAHAPYDQTHGPYGEAHALPAAKPSPNQLNLKFLSDSAHCSTHSIWNGLWFG
jgi:hypothetical protein